MKLLNNEENFKNYLFLKKKFLTLIRYIKLNTYNYSSNTFCIAHFPIVEHSHTASCVKFSDLISLSLSPSKDNIRIVELNSTDVMRSIIVDKIIQIYDFNKNINETKKLSNIPTSSPNNNQDCALIPKSHISKFY